MNTSTKLDLIQSGQETPVDIYSTHYQISVNCQNCQEHDWAWIIKGKSKKQIRDCGKKLLCKKCGCDVDV